MQPLGDLRVRVPERDQPHHLALAVAEHRPVLGSLLTGDHQRAEPGVQVVASLHREPEGLQQLGRLGLLEDVAAGAGAQRLARVLGVLAHRQDRHGQVGVRQEALRQRGET